MTDDPQTLARTNNLLLTLIDAVRALHADIVVRKSASSGPRVLSADDVRMLGALLPAIVGAIGGESFTVGSLLQAAQARTVKAKALRKAINETGMNGPTLGLLFGRASESETPIANLFLHRLGHLRDGWLNCVNANHRGHHAATSIADALRDTFQS